MFLSGCVSVNPHRKAWFSSSCLATSPRPHLANFSTSSSVPGGMAGIVGGDTAGTFLVQCLPLYTLIAALPVTTVNYLSLDIEGAELEVLETVPWDKVDIEVMTVETHHLGEEGEGRYMKIRRYLSLQELWRYFTRPYINLIVFQPQLTYKYQSKYLTQNPRITFTMLPWEWMMFSSEKISSRENTNQMRKS